jgi:hypothetical protein
MSFECDFCKKEYKTISSLNYHKKTAKFCLDLQKTYNDSCKYNCEFCNKKFTKKDKRDDHLKICKIKKDAIITDLENKIETLHNNINILKSANEKMLIEKDKEIEILKNELKSKNDYIESLEKKYNQLFEGNKEIVKHAINKPNSTINNNVIYNTMVSELIPFTPSNVQQCISNINHESFLFDYDNVISNFINCLVKVLKEMAMCTDNSRGTLLVKNEKGKTRKIISHEFIIECFESAPDQLLKICNDAYDFVRKNDPKIYSDEDQFNTLIKIHELMRTIKKKQTNTIVKEFGNTFIKHVKQYSKKLEKEQSNSLITTEKISNEDEKSNDSPRNNELYESNEETKEECNVIEDDEEDKLREKEMKEMFKNIPNKRIIDQYGIEYLDVEEEFEDDPDSYFNN